MTKAIGGKTHRGLGLLSGAGWEGGIQINKGGGTSQRQDGGVLGEAMKTEGEKIQSQENKGGRLNWMPVYNMLDL